MRLCQRSFGLAMLEQRFGLASAEGMDGSASPRLREQQKGCENASLMKNGA